MDKNVELKFKGWSNVDQIQSCSEVNSVVELVGSVQAAWACCGNSVVKVLSNRSEDHVVKSQHCQTTMVGSSSKTLNL